MYTPSIIVSFDSYNLHIGLSGQSIPTHVIPKTFLPVTQSPLTFATRLHYLILSYLHVPTGRVCEHDLVIAEPVIHFGDRERRLIRHAAEHILSLTGVTFHNSLSCVRAVLGGYQDTESETETEPKTPLVVYVGERYTVLQTAHALDIVVTASMDELDRKLRTLSGIVRKDSDSMEEVKDMHVSSKRLSHVVVNGKQRSEVFESLFCTNGEFNLAVRIKKFVEESVHDVYERARLLQTVVGVGEMAATPGFAHRLQHELRKTLPRASVDVLHTPFAAHCVVWVGAALLHEAQTTDRQ